MFSIFQMSEYGYGHHGFRPYGNPMHGARGGGPGGDRGEHRGDRGEGNYQLFITIYLLNLSRENKYVPEMLMYYNFGQKYTKIRESKNGYCE